MLRSVLMLGLLTAGCKDHRPVSAPTSPRVAGYATSLRGPLTTLDTEDIAATGTLPAGLLQVAAVYDDNNGCSVALRTAAGWFVGPPSAEPCRDPSYIDLESIDVETDGAIAAITFGINWHTKDAGDEASYKLTALCGLRAGVPACTPVFLSGCDAHAPAAGCADDAFELTWTLDGDRARFTPSRPIDNDAIPSGERTILGDP